MFAITSADPLFPLRTLEYVKEAPFSDPAEAKEAEGQPRDNISRICRHLLRQRSFYPIFPAPLAGGGMDGVNLDITHLDLLKFDDVSADVVVTPSKLGGQFIKVCFPHDLASLSESFFFFLDRRQCLPCQSLMRDQRTQRWHVCSLHHSSQRPKGVGSRGW